MTFTVTQDARGGLVTCEIAGIVGRARVLSAGVEEAKQRAEAQARALLRGAAIREALRAAG